MMLDPCKRHGSKRTRTAGLIAAGVLVLAGAPLLYANAGSDPSGSTTRRERGGQVHVAAPDARVNVDQASGKVRVKAPYTDVRVDPDRGAVRVRAPYVNLDVHW
jgi:hypothetical protein